MRSYFSYGAALIFAAACAHAPLDSIDGGPDKLAQKTKTDDTALKNGKKSCQRDWECGDGALCLDGQCVAITENTELCKSGRVHFDFDETTLHPDEYAALQRIARCLKADHKMHLTIDGNTDERGTLEYNLALGDKRARVVAKYLHDLGASDAQIGTVTYGKDRPLCPEHDEDCWRENRRAGLMAKRPEH